ncbi:DNA-binding protein response regulator KdpE [Rubellimicrobium mesophilum DSM 19309]|uniref:DNA-binding protein response regulator KdpE n=1 Tax=Rubellimicrobium mesophilum DSM 19309 TaxID=442562 RepID=A0A017HL04_9RHOB|nr:DNA-binding protein response regulator KdpE [Rubellimicrobium mesophilum DSM 19309]
MEAETAREALGRLDTERPELVLLDLGLPDRDGLEILPLILARSTARVLVVSAREATEEKVAALDLGADDFVTKPFDTDELLARVRVALRQRLAGSAPTRVLTVDGIEVDLVARHVQRGGAEVHLTPKEWGLLAELARHPGRVVTHAQLLRTVWGPAHEQDVEYLRVTVRSLRAKLESEPAVPKLITNEPGVGYRLMADA